MAKSKHKKQTGVSSEHLAEIRRKVLIESTGSSFRLFGSKVTNKQVEQIMVLSKLSEQMKVPRTK